ncbi:MAG: hypothetical protein HC914_15830 [Chloroflexaceae bacterium]|nr:hypothetical protein [Chloroflexaceae bacterium]
MTTVNADEMRRELALDQALRAQLDALVRLANAAIAKLASDEKTKLEKSQFSNLINVAMEPPGSVEVVLSFIKYQMGRRGSGWDAAQESFGHHLISDIQGPIKELADKAVACVQKQKIDTTTPMLDLVDLPTRAKSFTAFPYTNARFR